MTTSSGGYQIGSTWSNKLNQSKLNNGFQIGKYYKHSGGGVMHIIGSVKSTLYGWTLIAEEHGCSDFRPVGQDSDHAANWTETTEEVWMSGFS